MAINFDNPDIKCMIHFNIPDDSPLVEWSDEERQLLVSTLVLMTAYIYNIITEYRSFEGN